MSFIPNRETFRKMARPGVIVPVYREVISDELTPMAAYRRIGEGRRGFLLESVVSGEVIHPMRRHTVSASPFIELQVGDHVDLNLSLSFTQRELPGPKFLDTSNYEQLSRAAYAEPFSAFGSFNVRFHWDRSNGQRNDRFSGV